jgi:hypothetical protein
MMMKRLLITALVTVIGVGTAIGFTSTAEAGTRSPHIDQREARQQGRINQGIRSGVLTPRETYRLQRQQANIRAQEARFKSDGRFSKHERRVVRGRLNRSSQSIYRLKHNGRHH